MHKLKHLRPAFCLLLALLFCALPAAALAESGGESSDEGYTYEFDHYTDVMYMENLDTGTVVYTSNADQKMYPASLTKMMTFIVSYENTPNVETEKVTVTQSVADALAGTGSSLAGIMVGEELTVLQLLNLMMVPSGNDAAYVLAEHVGGGDVSAFVEKMNEKAQQLGCTNTHFMNPHGLHDEQHYTTARDIATIAKYALSLPYFADVVSQTYYTLAATNLSQARTVYATNRMLNQNTDEGKYYYQYAKGIKTGMTDQAGYCICALAVKDGYSYLAVCMGSPTKDANGQDIATHGEMLDAKALFDWAFSNFEMKTVLSAGEVLGETNLKYVWNQDTLQLVTTQACVALLPKDVETSSILVTLQVPESVDAPVSKGTKIGTAVLSYAGKTVATVDLAAAETLERSDLAATVEQGKTVVTSVWFGIIAVIIVLLIILYVVLAVVYNARRKKLRRVKRYRDDR